MPRELAGRATELDALTRALTRARAGEPGLCVVGGEAGIGRTALLREFGARAAAAGARVLIGGCVPAAAGPLPFAPVLEALRQVPDALRLADDDPTGPGRTRTFELFLRDLGRLARHGPVVLGLEDLHWADRSTLDLLAFLARNLTDEPVLLVLTWRSDSLGAGDPVRRWLAELPRLRPVVTLEPARLDRAGTAAQLSALLGREAPADLVDAVLARSEGNPLVTGSLVGSGGGLAAVPTPLRDMVRGRVAVLPDPTRALLRLAAAAGPRVRHPVLAALSGLPAAGLLEALRAAVDAHVLVPAADGGSYRFGQALVREVVYADLLPAERRDLHARLAEVLCRQPELRDPDPTRHAAEVADHRDGAGDPARALPASVEAGLGALRQHAYSEALRRLRRAVELWDVVAPPGPVAGADRAAVESAAGRAATLLGQSAEAVRLVEAACRRVGDGPPRRLAGLLNQLGRAWADAGRWEDAARAYERGSAVLVGEPASAERADALAGLAKLHASRPGDEGRRLATAAVEAAEAAGARAEAGRARHALGLALAHGGDGPAGLVELRHALAIAEDVGDPDDIGIAYINLSYLLGVVGRHDEAVLTALRGYRAARRLGVEREDGSFLLANAAETLIAVGRWDRADTVLRRAEAIAARGPREFAVLLCAARLRTGRGDFTGARDRLERIRRLLGTEGFGLWRRLYLTEAAGTAGWEGRIEDVRAAVAAGLDSYARTGQEHLAGELLGLGLRAEADAAARARSARDGRSLAAAVAAADGLAVRLDRIGAGRLPEDTATVRAARAELGRAHDDPDAGPWLAAATAWDDLGRPFPAAYARFRAAEVALRADGRSADAAAALRSAAATADRLGAVPLSAECRRLAGRHRLLPLAAGPAAGAVRAGGTARAGGTGPIGGAAAAGGLTAREMEVLDLLAVGNSNGQIARALVISPKTASVHVSNILRKLGADGRAEAARIAHHLDLPGAGRTPSGPAVREDDRARLRPP